MQTILARLKEPSTYAGIAAFIAGLTFLPHAAQYADEVSAIGVAIVGLLAIVLPEAPK